MPGSQDTHFTSDADHVSFETGGHGQADAPAQGGRWKPSFNPWLVTLTVTLATFMEVLDTNIANVALPHIAGSLAASQSEATWIISSYLVANAVSLPLSGYVSAIVGRKRFYMLCVAAFGISSLLCGLAPNLGCLLFFRVLQGLGGGGLQTSEQAILADTFEPEKLGQAFAVYGLAVVVAPAIGPLVGGWITDSYTWRWLFFLNVTVTILSLILTNRFVEDPPHLVKERERLRTSKTQVDYLGFAFTALAFASLEVVLDKGQEDDWFGSHFITTMVVFAVAGFVALIAWEINQVRKNHKPIIEVRLLTKPSFALAFSMMFLFGVVMYGSTILLPQFQQELLGYTAKDAGLTLSIGGIATVISMPIIGAVVAKVDARKMLALGFLICGVSLWYMSAITLDVNNGYLSEVRFFQSICLGLIFIPVQTLAYNGVPMELNADASGLVNLSRNIGGSVGTSVVGTLLARAAQRHQNYLSANLSGSESLYRSQVARVTDYLAQHGFSLPEAKAAAVGQIYTQLGIQARLLSYTDVIRLFSYLALIVVPFCFIVKRPKPAEGPMH